MPRLPRVHLEDVIYYVTLEGTQHEPVFREPADYIKYLELLGRYKKEYQIRLFAYALLHGRIYLLLEAGPAYSISRLMQKVTPLYTKYYNGKYDRKGHLFQKRFRSVIVEKEPYGARLTRFLHLLPVRAGAAQDFREYPYTSYAAFAGHPDAFAPDLSDEVREVLKDFPAGIIKENPYERFMLSADAGETEFFHKRLSRGAFLGSDDFVSTVKEQMAKQLHNDAAAAALPLPPVTGHALTKRLWVLSGGLMLLVIVSVYAVSLNLNAQAFLSRVNATPATARDTGKALLDTLIVSAPGPVEAAVPVLARALPEEAATEAGIKNVSPARPDLSGTTWTLELIPASVSGGTTSIKDKIQFTGKSFESHYFRSRGFLSTHYTVTIQDNGMITWKTIQKNPDGEMVSWRGDWQGDRMEGMLSYHPAGNSPQDFSFMSRGVTQ